MNPLIVNILVSVLVASGSATSSSANNDKGNEATSATPAAAAAKTKSNSNTSGDELIEEIRAMPVPAGKAKKKRQPVKPAKKSAATTGDSGDLEVETPMPVQHFHLSGYIMPGGSFRYRAAALPSDQWAAGFGDTIFGLSANGHISRRWSYAAELVISGALVQAITGVHLVDKNGDGNPNSVSTDTQSIVSEFVENLTVKYQPFRELSFKLGQMRIPFTAQSMSPNTALMFPQRSSPNQAFLSGTDLGFLARFSLPNYGRLGGLSIAAGVFNGTGPSGIDSGSHSLLYMARVDLSLGAPFPPGELDTRRGPFRIGIGAGMIYSPKSLFDSAGYASGQSRDFKGSVSLRLAYRGFYLQGELLRRQATDDLSSRPRVDTGAYGQMAVFIPWPVPYGFAPIARVGWVEADESFYPRETIWTTAGLTFFLSKAHPKDLRLTLEYLGEWRVTDAEQASGGALQVVYLF